MAGAVSRLPLLRADPPAARGGEGGFPDGGQTLVLREGDHAADRDRWHGEVTRMTVDTLSRVQDSVSSANTGPPSVRATSTTPAPYSTSRCAFYRQRLEITAETKNGLKICVVFCNYKVMFRTGSKGWRWRAA